MDPKNMVEAKQRQTAGDAEKKQIQAMIEQVALTNPEMHKRLSVAAVFALMGCEDDVLGWTAKGGISTNTKRLLVINHLELGLPVGRGYLKVLGGQVYITGAGLRYLSNKDPNWLIVKTKYKPLTPEMRKDLQLHERDFAVVRVDTIKQPHGVSKKVGIGIITADEAANNNVWGNGPRYNKAGKLVKGHDKKRDIIATLQTRADRDLLKRHYPVGLAVDDEHDGEPTEIVVSSDASKAIADLTDAQKAPTGVVVNDDVPPYNKTLTFAPVEKDDAWVEKLRLRVEALHKDFLTCADDDQIERVKVVFNGLTIDQMNAGKLSVVEDWLKEEIGVQDEVGRRDGYGK